MEENGGGNKKQRTPVQLKDNYSEDEKRIKAQEKRLLHKIQKVLKEQDIQLKAQHEYRVGIKKSLAGEDGGIGDM